MRALRARSPPPTPTSRETDEPLRQRPRPAARRRRLRPRRARAAGLERLSPQVDRDPAPRRRGGRLGEDVTYEATEHDLVQEQGPVLPLAGTWTLDSFSQHLATLPLFDHEPDQHAYLDYRRWGTRAPPSTSRFGKPDCRSVRRRPRGAAHVRRLDAARQAATTDRLKALARSLPQPPLQARRDGRLVERADRRARGHGAVDSVDFKGQYHGTSVDAEPDPALYRRVVDGLPGAWLEVPALTPETEAVLEPHQGRVTWDAVIHSVADIEALRRPPRTVNVKPSRFGSVERLFAAYDYCAARASTPTAAASSSSASGATRSSCSPRSSTRARRTTSRRAASTSIRRPGCRRARCPVVARATGFAIADR